MKCIYLSTSIFLVFVVGFRMSPPSQARISLTNSAPLTQVAGRPSMGHPREGTRRGGGSRGGMCNIPANLPTLTALMPDTSTWITENTYTTEVTDDAINEATNVVFSFTNRASPDLWFYLPDSLVDSRRIIFTLRGAAGETLKRAQLDTIGKLPKGPNIIRVSLSELGLMLTPAVDYHWYLTVMCEFGPPISVDGWLNYQPMDSSDPSDQKFLVDTLSVLAEAQWSNPENDTVQSVWRELLESVGLSDIVDAPPINCCDFVD